MNDRAQEESPIVVFRKRRAVETVGVGSTCRVEGICEAESVQIVHGCSPKGGIKRVIGMYLEASRTYRRHPHAGSLFEDGEGINSLPIRPEIRIYHRLS